MACETDGRFAVGRRRGGTGLASHGGPSCQNPVARWAREVLLGPRWCPAGYGCRRLTSVVCREYARKFVGDRHRRWSRACGRWSVNPSRKLRRFESFTCHHVCEKASDVMKEWGLLPLPAAPPSGMLGSVQVAYERARRPLNGSVCRLIVDRNMDE